MRWKTSRREIELDRTLVMGILNVTPDSFSDGGRFFAPKDALRHAEQLIKEGADILDIGGESTRPGSDRVSGVEEISRVVPIIESIAKRFDIPISVDTSRSQVAKAAVDAGAEIINDISGLRFDAKIAEVAARTKAGLVLMHSRGEFATMHTTEPADDIFSDVTEGLRRSIDIARSFGVGDESIAVDIGVGFGKTLDQNLELLANLDKIVRGFSDFPVLVGASRKSFIGKVMNDPLVKERLGGSLAAAAIAIWNGAKIIRAHDVRQTVQAVRIAEAIHSVAKEKKVVDQ